jgi:hypothetical protein
MLPLSAECSHSTLIGNRLHATPQAVIENATEREDDAAEKLATCLRFTELPA